MLNNVGHAKAINRISWQCTM